MMIRVILTFAALTVFTSCSKEKRSERAAEKMQEFVANISRYAKSLNPSFVIVPQNGVELALNNTDPNDGLNSSYLSAIDGFGVEELFYNGAYAPDNNRLSMLRQLRPLKKVMVSEYVSNRSFIQDAFSKNYNEGFIAFVRDSANYHYTQIPDTIPYENADDITNIALAQNYLYLINPDNFSTKQEMIDAISSTNFDLVIIDLFFKGEALTATEVARLKTKANGGRRLVLSYINIGAAESFRYYWKPDWRLGKPKWIKKKYKGYDDEFWVEFWNKEWQDIIFGNENSYMKKIIDAGFDGAYLDNVEAYYFLYHD